ncbi:hypothetical protein DF186_25895 [Enterococcus hirae]|nr:hypothetical protein DF186_25895 [Enterococcus hirae]
MMMTMVGVTVMISRATAMIEAGTPAIDSYGGRTPFSEWAFNGTNLSTQRQRKNHKASQKNECHPAD